jgi:hypothetical protein
VWGVLIMAGIGAELTMIHVVPVAVLAGLVWVGSGREHPFTLPVSARLRSNMCPTD